MIIKVPVYVELLGKVDTGLLDVVSNHLKDEFYFILRSKKIKKSFTFVGDKHSLSDCGVDDLKILSVDEALESLRVKR